MTVLKVYDVTTDEMREATQQTMDELHKLRSLVGKLIKIIRHVKPDLLPPSGIGFEGRLEYFIEEYFKIIRKK